MEYVAQPFKFNFKTKVIKDENGNKIGEGKKQPSIETSLPVLSAAGVITALQAGGKEAEVLLAQVNSIFYQAARAQFDDAIDNLPDSNMEISASVLDFDKLTLSYLANLPPSSRGSSALTEDEWNFFYSDYLQVMVAATGKEEKRILNQIEHFKRPQRVKVNGKVLEVLVDQLSIYVSKSAALEDTATCAERLMTKFSRWIAELAASNDPDAI